MVPIETYFEPIEMAIGENDSDDDGYISYAEEDDYTLFEYEEVDNDTLAPLYDTEWFDEAPAGSTYAPFEFTGEMPGPVKPVQTCLEAFELFLTNDIISLAVMETNRVLRAKHKKRRRSVEIERTEVTIDEFWVFLAVVILAEIHGKNDMEQNWKKDEFLFTPVFGKLMSYERWREISTCLHFANNYEDEDSTDRFWKARKISRFLIIDFQFI